MVIASHLLHAVSRSYEDSLKTGEKEKDVRNLFLENGSKERKKAQDIVNRRQLHYRYPLELLAGKYRSHTAYDFGYLYTVRNLHWWKREEEMIRRGKQGPFFMNIMDMAKIAGLKD